MGVLAGFFTSHGGVAQLRNIVAFLGGFRENAAHPFRGSVSILGEGEVRVRIPSAMGFVGL
jgi:hypothetical protein